MDYVWPALTLLFGGIGGMLIKHYIFDRVSFTYFMRPPSHFKFPATPPNDPIDFSAATIEIFNNSRQTISHIKIVMSSKPEGYYLEPSVPSEAAQEQDGKWTLSLSSSLGHKDGVTLHMLKPGKLDHISSDHGMAKDEKDSFYNSNTFAFLFFAAVVTFAIILTAVLFAYLS